MPSDRSRNNLPLPDPQHVGVTTYDAKDPDTAFPAIEPLRPPEGAPNVLLVLLDDVGFGASSAFGGPCETPTAERLAGRRPGLHPVPHHRPLCPDPGGAADRAQPSQRGHGRRSRPRHLGSRLQLGATQGGGTAGRDPPAQRLLDGPVRQVPRGPDVGEQPGRAVRPVADRERVRVLLRLHRRRHEPVVPRAVRGHVPGRADQDARGGLPPHRGPGRPRHRLDPPAEDAGAGQAVLRLLRPGRHPCPPSRPEGVDRPLPGSVRRRMGRAAGETFARQKELGRHPGRRRADRPPGGDSGLGRHRRRPQAGAGPPDGGLRRVPLPHRPPHRPADRRARGARDPGRHARPLPDRGQRSERRGHPARHLQRAAGVQPEHGPGDHRVPQGPHRRVRVAGGQQPLRRRVGPRHLHPLPVDQAGGVPLRRDPQRDGGPLAGRLHGQGRDPFPVPSRHRHRPDHPGCGRHPGPDIRATASSRCRCTG